MFTYPSMILVILLAVMLVLTIGIFSIIEWFMSRLAAFVAVFGAAVIIVIYLSYIISYISDKKAIMRSFKDNEANEKINMLKRNTLKSAGKIAVLMVIYCVSWGIIIAFINAWLFS